MVDDIPHPFTTRAATLANTAPTSSTTILKLPKVRTVTGLNSITYKSCADWNYLSNLYFPKKDGEENYKPPCSINKHLVKVALRNSLMEQYNNVNNDNSNDNNNSNSQRRRQQQQQQQ